MAKATVKELKKARKSAKKTQVQFKDRYPYLHQMEEWTGPFRRRTLAWKHGTILTMNPYTMGITAVYASNCHNMIPLLTGTGYDMLTPFKPVPRWREGFAMAYDIIMKWGKFFTRDEGFFIEYQIDMRGVPTFHLLLDSELSTWEDRLCEAAPAFESIHTWLTEQGVHDGADGVFQSVLPVASMSM